MPRQHGSAPPHQVCAVEVVGPSIQQARGCDGLRHWHTVSGRLGAGNEEMGVVLNPMKAAIMKAVIEKERREGRMPEMFEDDDEEFTNVEYL